MESHLLRASPAGTRPGADPGLRCCRPAGRDAAADPELGLSGVVATPARASLMLDAIVRAFPGYACERGRHSGARARSVPDEGPRAGRAGIRASHRPGAEPVALAAEAARSWSGFWPGTASTPRGSSPPSVPTPQGSFERN